MVRSISVMLLALAWGSNVQAQYTPIDAFPNLTFTSPIFVTHSPDGTNRMFLVQQGGLIRVFPNDSAVTPSAVTTFLNIANKLSSGSGEQGLLGLAFHPNFATNGYFYVNYTAPGPLRTVIERYRVPPGTPNKADSLSGYKIIEIGQPYTNHNGGMIQFGLDGYLYLGMGDGGSADDPGNRSQDSSQLLGKMLRLNVDDTTATTHYAIPSDNPFAAGFGPSVRREIWAIGMRNPWRWSIDPINGEFWAGDVGQGAREEVDLIWKGKNYGWKIMEGMICRPPTSGCDTTGLVLPIKDYPRSLGYSVTGGYIYRGHRRPELYGAYIYADYGSGRIWKLRYVNGTITEDLQLTQTGWFVSSFGTDQFGELYIVRYSSTSGKLYRFAGPPPPPNPAVVLMAPNGGEQWQYNTVRSILWYAAYVPSVSLAYRTSDAGEWTPIASGIPTGTGTYSWTIPGTPTSQARVRIMAQDSSLVDTSHSTFSILVPLITQSVDTIDFGQVPAGQTGIDSVSIGNNGTGTLSVTGVSIDSAAFLTLQGPFTVAPGNSRYVVVSFSPNLVGTYRGRLTLLTNAPGSPAVIHLVGQGSSSAGVGDDDEIPLTFELFQNFPNPFNPTTTIHYAVPATHHVTLIVYDMLGRLVAKLVDEVQEPGYKTISLNAASLASGTYYYRMTAGTFTATRRLMVVK